MVYLAIVLEQAFTVLRNPLDKFFSGVFSEAGRKAWIDRNTRKLESAPETLTVEDVNDLAKGGQVWEGY